MLARRRDSGAVRKANQLGHAPYPKLGHHAAAVHLDRLFDRAQACGNLLVEPAGDHMLQHLTLSVGEDGEPVVDRFEFLPFLA